MKQLEEDQIIIKVDEPTPWVNSLVIVPKQNLDIRICIDIEMMLIPTPGLDPIVIYIYWLKHPRGGNAA